MNPFILEDLATFTFFSKYSTYCTQNLFEYIGKLGRKDIFNIYFPKYQTSSDPIIFWLLDGACEKGHYFFCKWIVDNFGYKNLDRFWNALFCKACLGGNLQLFHFLLTKIQPFPPTFDKAFINACQGGHLHLAKFIKKHFTVSHKAINNGFVYVCEYDHPELFDYLLNLGADCYYIAINGASRTRNFNNIKKLVYLIDDDWNPPFLEACYLGDLQFVKWTISKGAHKFGKGLEAVLIGVDLCDEPGEKQYCQVAKLLLDQKPTPNEIYEPIYNEILCLIQKYI